MFPSGSKLFSITITKHNEGQDIKGTYFHPELVLKVLMWANTKLATEMEKIIWSAVIVENTVNRQIDDMIETFN